MFKVFKSFNGVGMRNLIDAFDKLARTELQDYIIVSKDRIDNLVSCFESGAKTIQELTKVIADQQEQIRILSLSLSKIESNSLDQTD